MMPLRPYQAGGVEFLRSRPRSFLGDEPGLGKSRQLIEASQGDTLVVAPAMVLDGGTWDEEIERWADDPSRFTTVSYSGTTLREKVGRGHRPSKTLIPQVDRHWDTLILDEAHYVKNGRATRTEAVVKIARKSDRVMLASGTPIPNWPQELFTLLQILHPKEAKPGQRYGSRWRWIEQWFDTRPNHYNPRATDVVGLAGCTEICGERPATDPCEHYMAFAAENLDGVFLQRLRDEVLTDLPPLTEQTIEVRMTPEQGKIYRQIKTKFAAMVDDDPVVAWSSAAKHVMLDRATTGIGVMMDEPTAKHSGKLDRLRFDLEQRDRPTLVVAHYQASVEAAAAVARETGRRAVTVHGGISRSVRGKAVQDFKDGKVDVLVGSLETIAEGLTLTQADMVIFLEQSYKPSRNQQALRRIHRLGQTRPCVALNYVCVTERGNPTIDGGKRTLLQTKTDLQMRTLTAAQLLAVS